MTVAYAVADRGHVASLYEMAGGATRMFLYANGGFADVSPPGAA